MKLIEEIPPQADRKLRGILYPGEAIRLCIASDMVNHRAFGEKWLAATDRRVLDGFEGTILVVSHDRYFLDKIVHRAAKQLEQLKTQLDDLYEKWMEEGI